MTILTSSYIDTSSAGCFTYSQPRLVHSELLEKEVRDINDFTEPLVKIVTTGFWCLDQVYLNMWPRTRVKPVTQVFIYNCSTTAVWVGRVSRQLWFLALVFLYSFLSCWVTLLRDQLINIVISMLTHLFWTFWKFLPPVELWPWTKGPTGRDHRRFSNNWVYAHLSWAYFS